MLYSKLMKPVALPPGRLKLSTKPPATGSAAPHPLALLRARRKRQHDDRAAKNCDELAPLHYRPRGAKWRQSYPAN
jgi:hypothetical protein